MAKRKQPSHSTKSQPKASPAKASVKAQPATARARKPVAVTKQHLANDRDDDDDESDDDDGIVEEEEEQGDEEQDEVQTTPSDNDQEEQEDQEEQQDEQPAVKKQKVEDGGDKKQSRVDQKALKAQRKGHKKHSELVESLKVKWEQVRRQDCPDSRRQALMAEMMAETKGRIADITFKHDASRIIQTMIKYGNEKQRAEIAAELSGRFVELASAKYGRFIVIRLLKNNPSLRPDITKEFMSRIRSHIKHINTSIVIEAIYTEYASSKERTHMVQEFYGPEFRLFKKDEVKSLADLLAKSPEKKAAVLKYMADTFMPILNKGILGDLTIVQRVVVEYLDNASEADCQVLYEALQPHLVGILHNKDGALITIKAIQHGSAKDRKVILKTFKSFVTKIASEDYGHLVLLQIFDAVDDTVLVSKSIVSELLTSLSLAFENKCFRKTIHFLVSPRNPKYFAPSVMQYMSHATSKKSQYARYVELLTPVSDPLLQLLHGMGAGKVADLLSDPDTAYFVVDVLVRARPSNEEVRDELFAMVAEQFVARSLDTAAPEDAKLQQAGNSSKQLLPRMVKSMVQYDATWAKAAEQGKHADIADGREELRAHLELVSTTLTEALLKCIASTDNAAHVLSTHAASWVIVAMCEREGTADRSKDMLRPFLGDLKSRQQQDKGAAQLVQLLEGQ
ncbi:Pumilio y domain member 6 [Sorochytrium milnesiophthora]